MTIYETFSWAQGSYYKDSIQFQYPACFQVNSGDRKKKILNYRYIFKESYLIFNWMSEKNNKPFKNEYIMFKLSLLAVSYEEIPAYWPTYFPLTVVVGFLTQKWKCKNPNVFFSLRETFQHGEHAIQKPSYVVILLCIWLRYTIVL